MSYLLPAIASGAPTLDMVHNCDALTLLRALPDASIDCVVTDPPYATTHILWDRLPDQSALFAEMRRVTKHRGIIAVFGTIQTLIRLPEAMLKQLRYHWVWQKNTVSGHLNAGVAPLRSHEMIFIFSDALAVSGAHREAARYYPQMQPTKREYHKRTADTMVHYSPSTMRKSSGNNGLRCPKDIIVFPHDSKRVHPTQKPVALCEYLIQTYTRPGELVLDPFSGSGTTAIAARKTGRHFICGDISREYVELARLRLAQPYTLSMFDTVTLKVTAPVQRDMFAGALP